MLKKENDEEIECYTENTNSYQIVKYVSLVLCVIVVFFYNIQKKDCRNQFKSVILVICIIITLANLIPINNESLNNTLTIGSLVLNCMWLMYLHHLHMSFFYYFYYVYKYQQNP